MPLSSAVGHDADLDRAEARLVRALVRPAGGGSGPLEALAGVAVWPEALTLAGRALWPLMAHRARGMALPDEVRARLEQARRDNLMVWLRRRAALRDTLAALSAAGFDATVLKGMAVAPRVYPAPELRTMSDTDLWIHAPTLAGVREALSPLGWQLPPRRDVGFLDVSQSLGLAMDDGRFVLELHVAPGSLRETVPRLMPAMVERRVATADGSVLAPADQLLHACVHVASHHQFTGGVTGLLDVAYLLASDGAALDWSAHVAEWRAHGAERWVAATMAASAVLFDVHAPEAAWRALAPETPEPYGATAAEIAWWSHATRENPAAVLAAGDSATIAREVTSRLGGLFRDREGWDVRAPLRLARRVAQFARDVAPVHLARVVRGEWRGPQAEDRRARRARLEALLRALAEPRDR